MGVSPGETGMISEELQVFVYYFAAVIWLLAPVDLVFLVAGLLELPLDDVISCHPGIALLIPGIFIIFFPQSFNDCFNRVLDWTGLSPIIWWGVTLVLFVITLVLGILKAIFEK